MLSFWVGIILSNSSCPNNSCPVSLSPYASLTVDADKGGELLPFETDVCDKNPHRMTHPTSLFPLIIEGNWMVIPGSLLSY